MSLFDPESFLSTTYNESTSTEFVPVPEGEYYAVATAVMPREVQTKSGPRVVLEVTWTIQGDLSESTGREVNTVKQGIFLDLTDRGHLDFSKGRNIRLGRLRDALGQNEDGKPWSPRDIIGKAARISVTHRMQGSDIYADVGEVAPF